eukprot:3228087-Rhodomonas_salina.1
MVLRTCYAVSGTATAQYSWSYASCPMVLRIYCAMSGSKTVNCLKVLRICYAMSGTEAACTAPRRVVHRCAHSARYALVSAYERSTHFPVLTYHMFLVLKSRTVLRYAGTDIAYDATRHYGCAS